MKKSEFIQLVLVAATLSSCNNLNRPPEKKAYLRSDTTAHYSPVHRGPFIGYYAFRPIGLYTGRGFTRAGYFSSAIHESSNIGANSFKGNVVRGGFGSSAFHVSS